MTNHADSLETPIDTLRDRSEEAILHEEMFLGFADTPLAEEIFNTEGSDHIFTDYILNVMSLVSDYNLSNLAGQYRSGEEIKCSTELLEKIKRKAISDDMGI